MSRQLVLVVCFAFFALVLRASTASSAEPEPAPKPAVPTFHRIYLPADEIDSRDWKQPYLPVDAAEFERDVQIVADGARGAPSAQPAKIEQAEYKARLVEDDILQGTATFTISSRREQTTLLRLTPCSVAIESATWQETGKPAILGTDPRGAMNLLVEGTTLQLQWSQKGERTASGAVRFPFQFPPSSIANIAISVPKMAEIAVETGVITKQTDEDFDERTWTIEFGGNEQLAIKVLPEGSGGQRRPLTLLRQTSTYEFTARGINVAAQLRLDVHGEPLERLELDLDPGLHLIGAKYGEVSIPWSSTADPNTGQSHVLLEFTEVLAGTGRVLQLSAVAPLVSNQSQLLPRLQPRGLAWQEGTAELLIPSILVLKQLLTFGCRQSRVTALPAPLAGESIEIQYFEPDAKVEIVIGEPRKALVLNRGTLVEIGASEISNRTVLELAAGTGKTKQLRIPVLPDWNVDSVASLPASNTVDWDVESVTGRPGELVILPGNAQRFVITGHRDMPEEKSFDARRLLMLDFAEIACERAHVDVRTTEGLELRWTALETLTRVEPDSLSREQLSLFPIAPEGAVFVEDDRFAQATLSVEDRPPTYAADIHIDAVAHNNSLTETFTILCTPEASRVERLLVHFSQARDEPLTWNLAGGHNSGQFSARKLSKGEQSQAGLRATGEVWELLLQLTRPGAFELRGQRTVPFVGMTPLALVSVDAASTQRGTLAIRSLGEAGISIKNRSLMSVPSELLNEDRYQTARATYHYQPSGDDLEAEAVVSIAPAKPTQAESGALAWSVQLDSRYAADGIAAHVATLQLETAGRRNIRFRLPSGASLHAAWLDQQPLPSKQFADRNQGWEIELPAGRSHARLRLEYSTVADLPTLAAWQSPPFPTLDAPVVHRRWALWLPGDYRVLDVQGNTPPDQIVLPTWSQRLFGPLGRGSDQHIFNPLLVSDWRELLSGGEETAAAWNAGQQFMENLGTQLGDYLDDEQLTWGQLLAAAAETETQLGQVLLVDGDELSQNRLSPQTRVAVQASTTSLDRGSQLLSTMGLVVIATPNGLLLTTSQRTSGFDERLLVRRVNSRVLVAQGSLASEIEASAAGSGTHLNRFESVMHWRAAYEASERAGVASDSIINDADVRGWRRYTIACGPGNSTQVRLVQTTRLNSLAWALFLGTVGLGLCRAFAKVWLLVALCGFFATACLVSPISYVPLCSAVLLGLLTCLAVRLTAITPRATPSTEPVRRTPKSTSSLIHPVATSLMFASIVNVGAALDAAPPDPILDRPTYSVLIPLDADQKPSGDKYYVPDSLYESLLRQASALQGRPRDWLLSRADYEGVLSRDPAKMRLEITRFRARYELQVFQTNVPVRLPIDRESWSSVITEARLDGNNLALNWAVDGKSLLLGNLVAGAHRVDFQLRPRIFAEPRRSGFELPIPPLGQASLSLAIPEDVTAMDIAGARGRVELDSKRGELKAQLGASDRLSVRWASGGALDIAAPNLEVEELIWIRVRPGTTVLDARFKYRVLSGNVKTLRLLADPRLRLLTSPTPASPIAAVHTIPGDPQLVELELAEAATSQVTIDLSFLVTDASGVGNLRLPRLEATEARSARRWLGVSVDPALQYRVQAGEDSRLLDIAEFLGSWGIGDAKPRTAYSIPRGEPIWFLATQPSEPELSVSQTTALGLGRQTTTVQFDAAISISSGVLAQLGIQGPPGFSVDQISVREQDVERVARWSANKAGRISVFLTTPIEGQQQLSLRGRWRPSDAQHFRTPQWSILGATVSRRQIQIYREPSVLATISVPVAAREYEPATTDLRSGLGALCGAYLLDDPEAEFQIDLSPNTPQIRTTTLTLLERENDRWIAELQCNVDVVGGLADTLQFEIPAQWSEPFRVEPSVPLSVTNIPGEQRRRLTLTPPKPLAGKQLYKIRGRVAPLPGDRLSVPDIIPLGATLLERYVALPKTLDSQQVTWDTLRLSPTKLPESFIPRGWNAGTMSLYQVAGEHFQASLKTVQRERASAVIRLADFQLEWLPGGSYRGVATFDIEPNGASHCTLQMPPGSDLLHATVEQLAASLSSLGKDAFRLALGPQQLPQRIELLYSGTAIARGNIREFQPPRLVDLNVDESLWTIYGLSQTGLSLNNTTIRRASATEQQLVRLENIAAVAELPAEVVGEHLPEEIARWYDAWRKRYWSGRRALQLELIANQQENTSSDETLTARRLDRQMSKMDERLGNSRTGMPQVRMTEDAAVFSQSLEIADPPQYYSMPDSVGSLRFREITPASNSFLPRSLSALALLCACVLAANWLRRRTIAHFSPAGILATLALAGWLVLAPSFVGLLALFVLGLIASWNLFSKHDSDAHAANQPVR